MRQARIDRAEKDGLTIEDKAKLAELRRENALLRMERDRVWADPIGYNSASVRLIERFESVV